MLRYIYRKEFHLTSEQFEEEPVHELFTNLYILAQIREKERIEAEQGRKGR